jgi:hypothetical protein
LCFARAACASVYFWSASASCGADTAGEVLRVAGGEERVELRLELGARLAVGDRGGARVEDVSDAHRRASSLPAMNGRRERVELGVSWRSWSSRHAWKVRSGRFEWSRSWR